MSNELPFFPLHFNSESEFLLKKGTFLNRELRNKRIPNSKGHFSLEKGKECKSQVRFSSLSVYRQEQIFSDLSSQGLSVFQFFFLNNELVSSAFEVGDLGLCSFFLILGYVVKYRW